MIEVTFGSGLGDSQAILTEKTDQITISGIKWLRGSEKPTIENGGTGASGMDQGAHVTAYAVMTRFIKWQLMGQTYLGAWERICDMWAFTERLLSEWYTVEGFKNATDPVVTMKLQNSVPKRAVGIRETRLVRGGVPLANAWFVRPLTGTDKEKREGRHYFASEPTPGKQFDSKYFEGPFRWKPNLSSEYVAQMNRELETWVEVRGWFPWTSLYTKSFRAGEKEQLDHLETLLIELQGTAAQSDLKRIAEFILGTFDFFPPKRPRGYGWNHDHAAALVARHLVEYFQYNRSIESAWRLPIVNAFIKAWFQRIRTDINTCQDRDLEGLEDLNAFRESLAEMILDVYYPSFAEAITWQ